MKKPKIIVAEAHSRMSLAIVREMGEAGYEVEAAARVSKGDVFLCGRSRRVKRRHLLSDGDYKNELLLLGANGSDGEKPVLFAPGIKTLELIADNRDEFERAFRFLAPRRKALSSAMDKTAVAAAAAELLLSVPREYDPDSPRFPCVIKYKNGEALGLAARERYAAFSGACGYAETLDAMRRRGGVFVTEYVAGPAHGVSAVLNKESEAVAVFCHRRVREYPVAGGPSCCAESVWEPGLIEQALALFKKIGLEGFAMAEFKGPVEKPYILEINPRVWGTYPLARASGAYFSVKYAEAAAGNGARTAESSNGCPYKNGVRMQFFANDLMHLLERRRLGVKTEGSVLLDFFSPRVAGGVFEISDLPGSLAYLRMLTKKGSAN